MRPCPISLPAAAVLAMETTIAGLFKLSNHRITIPMSNAENNGSGHERVVAFIDILGSSQILKSKDEDAIKSYLAGIEGLCISTAENVTDDVKMFSDNILIYSQGSTPDDVRSVVTSVAQIQWDVMRRSNLLIRGGVVIGKLERVPQKELDYVIGEGIVDAHDMESNKAVYPRVMVSDEVAEACPEHETLIKSDWDRPFIDYLQLSADGDLMFDNLNGYRQSLIAHIDANNRLCGCDTGRWDRIRNKDLWTLSYYNDFCSRNGSEGLIIDFEEHYDTEAKRIAICI